MNTIRYKLHGRLMPQIGKAIGTTVDDLAEDIVQAISTDVEVELGDVTVHLAMLLDPVHWESDWEERGVDDVDEFIAGLVTEEAPA